MHLFVLTAFLAIGAGTVDSLTDYVPDAWRKRAQLEMLLESSRPDIEGARLDEGIAQLVLGPFETLEFIRSDETDPRGTAHLQSAKFEVVRGDTCTGTVEVYEARPQLSDSLYPKAMLLGKFAGPEPCGYNPIETARAMARSSRSICELILPLELSAWRIILIDTEDRGTLVMEIPPQAPGGEADSAAVTIAPLAEWSAHAKKSLRGWLRLDKPLPPVSHDVPDDAIQAAEVWLRGPGESVIARAMSRTGVYGRPTLGEPTLGFFITELELALYAESDEPDPTRFDVNPRYIVPVVVEGREIQYAFLKWSRDELGRRGPYWKGDYTIEAGNVDFRSEVRPSALLQYGHVALMTTRAQDPGRWYHILGPDCALFTSFGWKVWVFIQGPDGTRRKGDGAAPDVVPLEVFAGWAKPQITDALRAWRASKWN